MLELQLFGRDGRQSVSGERAQVVRALTLLDFWSQTAVPSVLAEQSGRGVLDRRVRRGLLRLRGFAAMAAHDPALREPRAPEVRAVRAAGAAWTALAQALLLPTRASPARLARLADRAMQLHQRAYGIVDAVLLRRIAG